MKINICIDISSEDNQKNDELGISIESNQRNDALTEHLNRRNKQIQYEKEMLELSKDIAEFKDMEIIQFSKYMREWMKRHLKDESLCVGMVERMFQTPVSIYKQQFNFPDTK